ncbi:serine/threonine-protein phosphatase 6 regulatory subunit 2 isoform X7 [Bubalus bubalis]|uniref:serine/threonine-protein phosphatase 6 regulatory subunit 2 isoform X7 n=1 Tax=Bubalus bubalis TaxID=89462 RepID=UPI001E1B7669|nr:serine/threonine-protein phosphatase 6 regulatory subunit 2 isoform X7 [Bubalus bubalis]
MFWKFDLSAMSHVDKLLDKEGVTLRELMDGEDILQECKAQNRKLLDFLCRRQSMEELVGLVTQDPALDLEERARFKYPNTACELLTCDVPQISDRLGGDETLLNVLYNFLDREPPLNPLLASFFSKTIGNLIARKTEQVIAFLRKKDKFISLVLKHIGTSALMDLLLRLVSCVEPAGLRQEVLHWLNEEKTIQRLVELIHPSQDEDRQSNASQTLCDIIRLGREQGSQLLEAPQPDPLLTVLESQECVEQLLRNMFDGVQTELCLVSGTQVLLTLLEPRRAGSEGLLDSCSQGLDRPCSVSPGVLCGIEPRLKDFHQLLLSPPKDLFFKYTWNNFLHLQVELCIAAILSHAAREDRAAASGPEEALEPPPSSGDPAAPQPASSLPENTMVTHLFQKCCLVQRILEAWEANDHTQAAGGMRRGNMGHLTRIANAVVQNLEGGPLQSQVSEVFRGLPADCRGRWESFVEETLSEANRRNAVDLVSTHHLHPSSEDEDAEGVLPSELSLQQAFSEYQVQQMTATFVDQFGFSDEEFAEQDDSVNAPFDRIAEISFSVDADDDSPGAALFEACCSDHIQPFDEDDDLWEAEETHRAARVTRARFGGPHASERCPKDGPERRGQGAGEGVDAVQAGSPCEGGSEAGSSWAVFDGPVTPRATSPAPAVALDVGSSVWAAGSPSTSAPEEKGWAKFADFQPFCCSESGPRCSSPVDTGHGDTQAGLNQGLERTLGAWSTCVPRKAPLVVASSHEDEQKAAAASEAVGVGPSQKASPLSMSGPRGQLWTGRTPLLRGSHGWSLRADCAPSSPPSPAPAAPAEAAVTGPAPRALSPVLAVAVAPGPMVAVTTAAPASPAVSMAAALGTVTRDRLVGRRPQEPPSMAPCDAAAVQSWHPAQKSTW